MKGLIIKDFYCLKKRLINYGFILVGVVAISIMFVLSYQFGNIHTGIMDMVDSNEITHTQIVKIASMALLLFMLVPIACTGDVTSLFLDDAGASFYKLAAAMPISTNKRVASRYITSLLLIGIGVLVDVLMVVVISQVTDLISFWHFCGIIVSFSSLMVIYISMVITLMYLCGHTAATYAGMVPLGVFVVVGVAANIKNLKAFWVGEDDDAIFEIYNNLMDFTQDKLYILFIAALIIAAVSYVVSVILADKKKGVA